MNTSHAPLRCCYFNRISLQVQCVSSDKMGSKRRSSDIISLLVSIYGSKDIFIDEYRAVLADRLLHQLNYNTARYILLPLIKTWMSIFLHY